MAPHEKLAIPHVVSTLFPQLPHPSMQGFRLALTIAIALVLGVGALGYYSVAVALAAVAVPALVVVYLYDVDIYEDQPWFVVAFTALWGALVGVLASFSLHALSPTATESTPDGFGGSVPEVVIPVVGFLAAVLGSVAILLPYHSFNDLLDGTTFGSVSATFANSALVIVLAAPLFSEGLRPTGTVVPWVLLLVETAVALPLLWAALGATVAGSFWLRFRGTPGVRHMRVLGSPLLETMLAIVVLGLLATARLALQTWAFLVVVLLCLAVALTRLRRLVHAGLMDEALEIGIGPEVRCPNCGNFTPSHLFCGRCGVARRALPKAVGALPEVR